MSPVIDERARALRKFNIGRCTDHPDIDINDWREDAVAELSTSWLFDLTRRAYGAQWRSMELCDNLSQGTVYAESSSYYGGIYDFNLTTIGSSG